jgi:hypothetical protein
LAGESDTKEFLTLRSAIVEILDARGTEEWDYSLTYVPLDIRIICVALNNVRLFETRLVELFREALGLCRAAWGVRFEIYDNIRGNTMIGGDNIGEILITRDGAVGWKNPDSSIDFNNHSNSQSKRE